MITLERPKKPCTSDPVSLPRTPALQISVLGPLTIRRGHLEYGANDLGGPKPRQVLEILLLNFGSAVSKSRIMDLLWGANPPAAALPTLEAYVSVLRRHLQPGTGRTGPLRTVTGGYVIDRSLVSLDLDRFETLTKQASQAAPQAALPLLTEALELASAPLLGDELIPTWAQAERALHADRVSIARVQAAEAALTVGQTGKAISWAEAAVREDDLNERAWTALILALERNGDSTAAIRAFDRCRRALDEALGCAPGQPLQEAHIRLLSMTAATTGPANVPSPSHPAPDGHPAALQVATGEDLKRRTILIVDDHTTFSDVLTGALKPEPDLESVGAAKSLDSAVTLFHELRPDVVIMDLHLPDGSGLQAAQRILTEAPQTRIIILTGNPTREALRAAATIGVCGFLPKDGSLRVMLDALRHAHPGNMIVHPSPLAGFCGSAA